MQPFENANTSPDVYGGTEPHNPDQHPYRPMPDPATGALTIDPEIELRAKKFNLAISFFYSSHSTVNAEYGRSRSASVRGYVMSEVSGTMVTATRGNFVDNGYVFTIMSGGISSYFAVPGFGF